MLLPIVERRHLMAEQARQMVAHYEQTASERQAWQGPLPGDELNQQGDGP